MKFAIQTNIRNEPIHDFSFHLMKAIEFQHWQENEDFNYLKIDYIDLFNLNPENIVPVGSVEFVRDFLLHFNQGKVPKPKNVPKELIPYAGRRIWKGVRRDITQSKEQPLFVKSNTKFKSEYNGINEGYNAMLLPEDEYQISEVIHDIESEWRAFIFKDNLVGLQNYSGKFDVFPDVREIIKMIEAYKNAPVAYTLDVWVRDGKTYAMEVHDFFSVGLYGFSEYSILPAMFSQWFFEFKRNS